MPGVHNGINPDAKSGGELKLKFGHHRLPLLAPVMPGVRYEKMEFKLKPDNRNATDAELLEDLLKVAKQLGMQSIKTRDYDKIGRFHSGTIARRFHGWNKALEKAGLRITKWFNISDSELIADVKRVADEVALKGLPKEYTMRKANTHLPL